jgi:CHAT domain-containing protein
LTALEVAQLDLSGVELAVLSACETGLGEAAGGEGVLGLQRAFQVAGTRSVVASLWKVDDDATRQLMVRLYENLWRTKQPLGKLEALRQAQLEMLREGRKRGPGGERPVDPEALKRAVPAAGRTPPFYWAAFVLSGDWR